MADFHIQFFGANAYVPRTDRLEVYMPNATRLGTSPQRDLSPHWPTLWQFDYSKRNRLWKPENRRYFPWYEAEIGFDFVGDPAPLNLTALQNIGEDPAHRLKLSPSRLQDPHHLAAKVVIRHGVVTPRESGDPAYQVRDWSATDPGYPRSTVLNRLHVKVVASKMTVRFTSLLQNGPPLAQVEIDDDHPIRLAIGNVCAMSHLMWHSNDEQHFPDRDFSWLYELVDSPPSGQPHPVIDQRRTGILPTYTPQQVLNVIDTGGGGGIGAECMGILADVGSP